MESFVEFTELQSTLTARDEHAVSCTTRMATGMFFTKAYL